MAEFKKKNKYQFWHSPMMLGLMFIILIIFSINIAGLIGKERDTAKKKLIDLSKIETLRKRDNTLSESISKLKTDQGIEETIRDKYQVAKQGEKVVVIVDGNPNTVNPDDAITDHTFWGFIKRMFGIK